MKRNTLLTLCAITALGATTALGIVKATPVAPASVTTFTWVGSNNANGDDWRVRANWDKNQSYPQSGDIAIIANVTTKNPIIDQQDEAVGELDISNGGLLTITGKTLTLGGAVTHDLNDNLVLSNSTAIVKFTADATVDGRGAIIGQDDDAEVRIAAGKVLTSRMSIVGNMKIVGETGGTAGKLDNRGLVHANANGRFTLDSNLIVVDTSGDRWDASDNSNAVLVFDAAIDCDTLAGSFNLDDCAEIEFNATVYTSGSFTTGDGLVDVNPDDQSVCFNYSCNSGCSSCTQVCEDTEYGDCG